MSIFGAEVIGTALLILLGNGVVAGVLLKLSKAENTGWIVITFGWGMAVMVGVFAVAQFDGAHLNPAITLGFAVAGTTAWGDVPEYLAGEFVGAFIGATLVWLLATLTQLFCGALIFKILHRETSRYRQFLETR